MKKILGASVPIFVIHLICCGALLFFLISSGLLLTFSQEGRNKTFLIPILLLGGALAWLYQYQGKCCSQKGSKTFGDHMISVVLYLSISLIFGFAFIIYIFIPWWIPDYKGGILLP